MKDGQNGFLVPPGNVEQLAEKIILILNDDELWGRFSDCARAEGERFRANKIASRTIDVYSQFLTVRIWRLT